VFCESTQQALAMFVAAADEVAGNADVKRTVAPIGHEINEATAHSLQVNKTWMAGTSPAMTSA
jgi:hypothetical protein